MVDFISELVSQLVGFLISLGDFLRFFVSFPSTLLSIFISLPTFMQIGFSVLFAFFVGFVILRIYALIH